MNECAHVSKVEAVSAHRSISFFFFDRLGRSTYRFFKISKPVNKLLSSSTLLADRSLHTFEQHTSHQRVQGPFYYSGRKKKETSMLVPPRYHRHRRDWHDSTTLLAQRTYRYVRSLHNESINSKFDPRYWIRPCVPWYG